MEAKNFPSPLTLSLIHRSNLARDTTAKAYKTGDGGEDSFCRQDTASTHNWDEMLVAHNLKKKDKGEEKLSKEEEERKFINGILASTNKTSWMLGTQQPPSKQSRIWSTRAVFWTDVPMTARLLHAVDNDDAWVDGDWTGRAYKKMPMIWWRHR